MLAPAALRWLARVPRRCVALSANAAFITCGLTARLWLVVALHYVLVPVNTWRLWKTLDRQWEGQAQEPAPASP